jgi:hypothetical protein
LSRFMGECVHGLQIRRGNIDNDRQADARHHTAHKKQSQKHGVLDILKQLKLYTEYCKSRESIILCSGIDECPSLPL